MSKTTHRMTIDVQAWRVSEDGSLPQEARELVSIATRKGDMWTGWSTGRQERFYAEPGDWIVLTPYGLIAMTDEQFRARCIDASIEPDSDAEFVHKYPLLNVPTCNGTPLARQRGDKIFDTDLAYVQEVGREKYLEERSHYNRPPSGPDTLAHLKSGKPCPGKLCDGGCRWNLCTEVDDGSPTLDH